MNCPQRSPQKILRFVVALLASAFLAGGCAAIFDAQPKDFFTRNYGEFLFPPEDDEVQDDEPETVEDEQFAENEDGPAEESDPAEESQEEAEPIEASDSPPPEPDPEPLEGESLEEKLYELAKKCYEERDRHCFEERRSIFNVSFPDSEYRGRINSLNEEFYFDPVIDTVDLDAGLLEIDMPFFDNRPAMREYFKTIIDFGVKEVSWNPFQQKGEKKILFASGNHDYGAYFKTDLLPVFEDVLGEMLEITRERGVKFYVRVPVRDHPWLEYRHSLLMTQTWDSRQRTEYYLPRLNLMNPRAEGYFLALLRDLLKYPIDGIIFESDYTIGFEEGFSTLNRILYEDETGVLLNPPRFFSEEILKLRSEEFAELYKPENPMLRDYTQWKSDRMQKFLIAAMDFVKFYGGDIEVGVETTPDLILKPKVSFFLHSVSGNSVSGLPVDFFILDPTHLEDGKPHGERAYAKALNFLARNKYLGQRVLVKAQIANKSEGVEGINIPIREGIRLAERINEERIVIGSVNRLKNTDILLNYLY